MLVHLRDWADIDSADSGQPMARLTRAARRQILACESGRWPGSGSWRLPRMTTAMLSARAAQSIRNPVSAAGRSRCAGPSRWIDVERGTTRTVAARSCRLRASADTMMTGLRRLPGGSVWTFVHQISQRWGRRCRVIVAAGPSLRVATQRTGSKRSVLRSRPRFESRSNRHTLRRWRGAGGSSSTP